MDIFESNKIILFIVFFVPGFISMKVYHLLIACEKTNFSEAISEAIGFSSINFALLSWLIILVNKNNFYNTHFYIYMTSWIFILFIGPILWTIIYVYIAKSKKIRKYIMSPIKNPWDYFFEQKKSCWIIVNLKNGEKIGGVYSDNSFSSAYPHKEQIYLEELWEIDSDGNFLKQKNRTTGIIVLGDDIKSIEFYN